MLFLEPEGSEFDDDGRRSAVIRDDRKRYSEQIKELLRQSGRSFISLSGDYEQRYESAGQLVNELLKPRA